MRTRTWTVALLYVAVTAIMTWPIVVRVDRDLPGDLGDPAFVAGVMTWGAEHWLALLAGDLQAAWRFWHAPIFHPEPLTLAYSEHFALHSFLALPVYAATRNPVLIYNLTFLSTFALAGNGMYLLVRELLGTRGFSPAAFVAGLAFAFAPYRVGTLAHLQVLSSHWMPFVLLGLHRYFRTGSGTALVGAGAALWAQNLSSGYYMLFFGPFVALFALAEMWVSGAWRRLVVWRDLLVTAGVTLVATLPFALPYLERTSGTRRSLGEVVWFSADLQGWLTASPLLHVWGHLQTFVKAEGMLFPGVTVVALALLGLWRGGTLARGATLFAAVAVPLSFWLSLGPEIQTATEPVAFPAPYRWLWEYVPGYHAARVPARFATITILSLSLLAGLGLAVLEVRGRRLMVALCALAILAEGAAFPLPTNGTWTSAPGELVAPKPRLHTLADAPAIYRYIRALDRGSVILHFPFGVPEREIRYGYYAMLHGRRIVNGYSGATPPFYELRFNALRHPVDPEAVRMALDLDGVTHVIVHADAYAGSQGGHLIELLRRIGWRPAARVEGDEVFVR